MPKTVVGLFSSMAEATRIKTALLSEGYTSQNVHVMANDVDGEAEGGTDLVDSRETSSTSSTSSAAEGIGQKIGAFFHNLTGGDEHAHQHYATGLNGGGALVAVTCADDAASSVAAILKQH